MLIYHNLTHTIFHFLICRMTYNFVTFFLSLSNPLFSYNCKISNYIFCAQINISWGTGFGMLAITLAMSLIIFFLEIKRCQKQGPLGVHDHYSGTGAYGSNAEVARG